MCSARMAAPLASFDIFDTVLLRAVTSPDAIHLLVGNRLVDAEAIGGSAEDYAVARIAAERRAGPAAVGRAPTLENIFAEFRGPLAEQSEALHQAMAEEIAVEHELLRPVPGAAQRIEIARSSASGVAFVSDMHLPAAELEKALRRFDLFRDSDRLVVSSEVGASKSNDGALFADLAKHPDVDPLQTTHFGNDSWSDVKMARKHGFAAVHLAAANPNRYEEILEAHSVATGGLSSLFAGAAREARLTTLAAKTRPSSERATEIQTVAADVAAPVLLSFVLWALRRCREEGITKAFFLTRDGELPLEIAKRLPANLTDGLELKMLGVGRAAIAVPAVAAVDFDRWLDAGITTSSFLLQHANELPATTILPRIGLDGPEHRELVARHVTIPDGPFPAEALEQFLTDCRTGELREAIIAESQARVSTVLDYLRQSGVTGSERVAMIDVGWTGQQSAMLSALTEMAGGQPPLHLHIGRRGNRPLMHDADIDQWLFDELVAPSPIANPVALFEAFCVTLSESVVGYERVGDRVEVVRRDGQHDEALLKWGQAVMRESILTMIDLARLDDSLAKVDADLTAASVELLREFWDSPTVAEAHAWGAFPFERDQLGKVVRTLAVRYDRRQLRSRQTGDFSGLDWKAGSVAISNPAMRAVLQQGEKFRSRFGR